MIIKTAEEIAKMRIANQMVVDTFAMLDPYVREGISTNELDQLCHDYITQTLKAIPAPLGYHGYPKSICTSINHVICHGIPSDKKLKNGDIIGVDISLSKDGYFGDSCKTYIIGKPSIMAERLVRCTQEALYLAIQAVKPGLNIKEIGKIIEEHAQQYNYTIVREFCGHGIGTKLHENDIEVLHYYEPRYKDLYLEPGMTFTIEPMINAGKRNLKVLSDGWTAVTKDHALSAQWEHTLLVTEAGCDVLTKRAEEVI